MSKTALQVPVEGVPKNAFRGKSLFFQKNFQFCVQMCLVTASRGGTKKSFLSFKTFFAPIPPTPTSLKSVAFVPQSTLFRLRRNKLNYHIKIPEGESFKLVAKPFSRKYDTYGAKLYFSYVLDYQLFLR